MPIMLISDDVFYGAIDSLDTEWWTECEPPCILKWQYMVDEVLKKESRSRHIRDPLHVEANNEGAVAHALRNV